MTDEGVQNLFKDFSVLQEGAAKNKKGSGLGLMICKSIVQQMGGDIKVFSKKDVGTVFKITLETKFRKPNQSDLINLGKL
jgi:K+-sensing histidine kinase KdpD